ncbi:hypothetical protein RJ55_03869 [Drechmeria coniospora]|nr:hypothetical protein RJ55_03869 [Drechmeria coniospora]
MSKLKSTYVPSAAVLPPGWTEHKAPSGHSYYYNADTKESTYKRPGASQPQAEPVFTPNPYSGIPNLSDPRVANAYLAQLGNAQPPSGARDGHDGRRGRGGHDGRPRPQPVDKPRRKEAIPGHEPWLLVYTKYSRRFVYNPVKKASYWRFPEKLMPAILELDKARISSKAATEDEGGEKPLAGPQPAPRPERIRETAAEADGDGSEYEEVEVEVTDDEGQGADDEDELGGRHPSKRQRTDGTDEDEADQGPVEFTEADIAAQLQMMGAEYGLEPGDYDDGNMEDWPEGTEGVEFSEDDARFLFKDLLNDFGINPYSPWDQLLDDGKIVDDARYTALTTTKARRECWDEWSREKIIEMKERRAKEERKDPKVAYLAFLQDKASPKLYWPEFKRKYKKEEPMKEAKLSDKEREKLYREHISRLKMSQPARKSDLAALLKSQPAHLLHSKSMSTGLPTQMLSDTRYISLEPSVRDPLVEAYVQALPPPPEDAAAAEEDEERRKDREARHRREQALEERNRAVEEQKRRREREVAASKARLREGEREIEEAMRVGKRGLQSQLGDG